MTSTRPDPLDELRAVASFAVGAAVLIGVGYLVSRVVRRRQEQGKNRLRGDERGRRPMGSGASSSRAEPLHELLARLDSPEAIERHNDLVRQMHENARPGRERAVEQSAQ